MSKDRQLTYNGRWSMGLLAALLCALLCAGPAAAQKVSAAEVQTETHSDGQEGTQDEAQTGTQPEVPMPDLPMDLSGYLQENEDVLGALYVPALSLCYPVVWKEYENDFYMEHDAWKAPSDHGSIMMDGWNACDFSDCLTFIHGHNMADGTMFGSLRLFLEDQTLAQNEPYIYYYDYVRNDELNKDGHVVRADSPIVMCFQIVGYYTTDIYDRTYDQPEIYAYYHGPRWDSDLPEVREALQALRNGWYDSFVADIPARAAHALPMPSFEDRPRLMALSTCYGAVHSDERLVIVCALISSQPEA